ncbi:MAG: hypothetical protein AAB546_03965 [Patescibacteria group bacterium]
MSGERVHDDYTIFYISKTKYKPYYNRNESQTAFPYLWYRVPGGIPLNNTLADDPLIKIAPRGEGVMYRGGCTGSDTLWDTAKGILEVIREGRLGLNPEKVAFVTAKLNPDDRDKFIKAMADLLKQQKDLDS